MTKTKIQGKLRKFTYFNQEKGQISSSVHIILFLFTCEKDLYAKSRRNSKLQVGNGISYEFVEGKRRKGTFPSSFGQHFEVDRKWIELIYALRFLIQLPRHIAFRIRTILSTFFCVMSNDWIEASVAGWETCGSDLI
jgi:hypothetical protein